MFKFVACALVCAVALAPSVLRAERATGDIAGIVTDQLGRTHANYLVRARQMSLAASVVAVGSTTAAGNFMLPNLAPGDDYVLEVLSGGAVVATSRLVTVTAGKAASVELTATNEAPMAPIPRRIGTTIGTIAVAGLGAAAATATAIVSNNMNASPSR